MLPETGVEEAAEIAERIRASVAARAVVVDTAPGPIHVTVSIGIAAYPTRRGVAQRPRARGRPRRLPRQGAGAEPRGDRGRRDCTGGAGHAATCRHAQCRAARAAPARLGRAALDGGARRDRRRRRPACCWATGGDVLGMLAIVGIVGLVQALADQSQEAASVNAVGLLSGAALFGPRVALAIAATACVVEWGRTRTTPARLAFDIGVLTLASLAAAAVFTVRPQGVDEQAGIIAAGVIAGLVLLRGGGRRAARHRGPARRHLGLERLAYVSELAAAADGRGRPPRGHRDHRLRHLRPLDSGPDRGAAAARALDAGSRGGPRPAGAPRSSRRMSGRSRSGRDRSSARTRRCASSRRRSSRR